MSDRVYGANERIGVGVIGFGLVGREHVRNFHAQPDSRVVAVCDTYRPRMEAAAALTGGAAAPYADFRKLLDDKHVDAVVVAAPDHWHALMTMMACAAGKDVYVEKPLTLFVREGRWMVEVARRYQRVVQVGTQQRSAPHFERAKRLIQDGRLGKIVHVQIDFWRNLMPGFGYPADQDPPAGLDWDMFLGPAPLRAYNPNRGIYHFRWCWDTAGGQMTNLGQHSLDTVHWALDLPPPTAVTSSGGRFFLKDNCETPDTQIAVIEYPGFNAVCQWQECSAGAATTEMGALGFFGSKGNLRLTRGSLKLTPDRKHNPTNVVAQIMGPHPPGGPQMVPEPLAYWGEPAQDDGADGGNQYVLHARNFLDCIRSRKEPNSDVERGHRVATVCHLANISLRTGRKIRWDGEKEEILDDPQAAAMLVRPYRKPWDAVLRALGVV
jgi:predicted dehydrogenase